MDWKLVNDVLVGFFGAALVIGMYMLPALIAYRRGHHNRGSIATINAFFGWTILGWVIALAMATGGVRDDRR